MDEIKFLEEISENSVYGQGASKICACYCGEIFLRNMIDGSVLELGPADGMMTDILYPQYKNDYTIVDGSSLFVKRLRERYPAIKGFTSLFEEFSPTRKYSNIILGHVLEHVKDPVEVLILCRNWLDNNGVILAAVPNANSIHRQAAVKMGLIEKPDDFSEKDRRHGHRRVFFKDTFADCFLKADLRIVKSGGYWLKSLSDAQIEQNWTKDMIDAFLSLGESYPDIAGEMYIVATG